MQKPSLIDYLKSYPLYLLPKHILSALLHRFMRIKHPGIKNNQIELFLKAFPVNMDEAEKQHASNYEDEQLFQAKGQNYTLTELLGGDASLTELFRNGTFLTIYLSPKDYHRIHMPINGTLKQMVHVPGDLFSVNTSSVKTIPRLFARNERVINIFDTASGYMALIQVGAIFVSSIETVWHGVVTPPRKRFIQHWSYNNNEGDISLKQCEEMGRFNMGSTVILLFAKDKIELSQELKNGNNIQLGNVLGSVIND